MAYRYRRMRKHGWRRSRSPDATACGVADYTSDSDSEEDKYHWRHPAPSDGGNGDRRRYWRERSDGGKGDRRRLRSVSRPRADRRRRRSRSRGVSRSRPQARRSWSSESTACGAAEGRDRGRRGRRRSSKRPPQGPQGGRSRGSKRPRQGPQGLEEAATGAAEGRDRGRLSNSYGGGNFKLVDLVPSGALDPERPELRASGLLVGEHTKGTEVTCLMHQLHGQHGGDGYKAVTRTFFNQHEMFKARLAEAQAAEAKQGWGAPVMYSMKPRGSVSEVTMTRGAARSKSQVDGKVIQHCGEVRTWQTQPDHWVRLDPDSEFHSWEKLGGDHYQTAVGKTRKERTAACGAGNSFADTVFSHAHVCDGCSPDFDNAISTLAVYDAHDPTKICIRMVRGITLAEVFSHYLEDIKYEYLMACWLEGKRLAGPMTRWTSAARCLDRAATTWTRSNIQKEEDDIRAEGKRQPYQRQLQQGGREYRPDATWGPTTALDAHWPGTPSNLWRRA